MIEAVMLVALGFLSASLLALACVPALGRRADRLARKRAQAAFPLSLAEIVADRDHLRAELALRARALEQQAEKGFAAKAVAMQELGRRDMTIGQRDRDLDARAHRIAVLEDELGAARTQLAETQAALARETAALSEVSATLDNRLADLAAVEDSLTEARSALTGTSADLAERIAEIAQERATLGRTQALLAERDAELASLRQEAGQIRVAQVESRTQLMVLEGKRDELSTLVARHERALAEAAAALKAMSADRDGERLRANALSARAEQAEAGLAAADARSTVATNEAVRLEERLALALHEQSAAGGALEASERELARMQAEHETECERMTSEMAGLSGRLRERESEIQDIHAQVQTLQGALTQARNDRAALKRELSAARKSGAPEPGDEASAALRQEIMKVAERVMGLPRKQEAAE